MKKYHNDLGPGLEVFERALHMVDAQYDKGDSDYSVTELTQPPQIRHLLRVHGHEIIYPVSGELFRLQGTLVHSLLESAGSAHPEDKTEQRLFTTTDVDGVEAVVSGKYDYYNGQRKAIEDYKYTSVWSLVWGLKPEWEFQINALVWLGRLNGLEVTEGAITVFYRDFQAKKAGDGKYPAMPAERVLVPLWGDYTSHKRVGEAIQEAREADAGDPRPCTDKERWVTRGVANRCKGYCAVKQWCPQFNGA